MSARPSGEVAITILTADSEYFMTAQLNQTSTAQALLALLPLHLRFGDLNGVEKLARLPRALTMAGMPVGDDPEPADVGYYAPSGDLVLYYGDVGFWPGIARIGRLPQDAARVLAELGEDFTAVITAGD